MMTEQLLREPLATAIQDKLDVEGIRALLGEARSNILEVRKAVLTRSLCANTWHPVYGARC